MSQNWSAAALAKTVFKIVGTGQCRGIQHHGRRLGLARPRRAHPHEVRIGKMRRQHVVEIGGAGAPCQHAGVKRQMNKHAGIESPDRRHEDRRCQEARIFRHLRKMLVARQAAGAVRRQSPDSWRAIIALPPPL